MNKRFFLIFYVWVQILFCTLVFAQSPEQDKKTLEEELLKNLIIDLSNSIQTTTKTFKVNVPMPSGCISETDTETCKKLIKNQINSDSDKFWSQKFYYYEVMNIDEWLIAYDNRISLVDLHKGLKYIDFSNVKLSQKTTELITKLGFTSCLALPNAVFQLECAEARNLEMIALKKVNYDFILVDSAKYIRFKNSNFVTSDQIELFRNEKEIRSNQSTLSDAKVLYKMYLLLRSKPYAPMGFISNEADSWPGMLSKVFPDVSVAANTGDEIQDWINANAFPTSNAASDESQTIDSDVLKNQIAQGLQLLQKYNKILDQPVNCNANSWIKIKNVEPVQEPPSSKRMASAVKEMAPPGNDYVINRLKNDCDTLPTCTERADRFIDYSDLQKFQKNFLDTNANYGVYWDCISPNFSPKPFKQVFKFKYIEDKGEISCLGL